MRLIDADALIKRCMNGIDNEFIGIVNEIPTVKVLDKIRAEIDSAKLPKNRMSFLRDGIDYALEIIDKYTKGEGE
mgnify:CR=1 FL=1